MNLPWRRERYTIWAMASPRIGVDVVEVGRFARLRAHERFLANVFTKKERSYCQGFRDAAPHFAGTFAAKEAACKALGGRDALTSFEIRRTKKGKPEIWKNRKKLPLALSISHEGAYAVAVCLGYGV